MQEQEQDQGKGSECLLPTDLRIEPPSLWFLMDLRDRSTRESWCPPNRREDECGGEQERPVLGGGGCGPWPAAGDRAGDLEKRG